MHETYIDLMDFNGSTYRIDYNGNTIDYKESEDCKQMKLFTAKMKSKTPWWRFW